MCDEIGAPGWKARAQLRLAKVLLEQQPQEAREVLARALAAAERIGMRRLLAQAHEAGARS